MSPFDELTIEARVFRRLGQTDWADAIEYAVSFLRERGVEKPGVRSSISEAPQPPRANRPYTQQEKDLVRRMWGEGLPISKIAESMGRVHLAIYKLAVNDMRLPRRPGDRSTPASPLTLPLMNGNGGNHA